MLKSRKLPMLIADLCNLQFESLDIYDAAAREFTGGH
jgi:hypothetical protein